MPYTLRSFRAGLLTVLAVGSIFFTVGCGGDEESAPSADDPAASTSPDSDEAAPDAGESDPEVFDTDPCELLTDADVKDILGTAAKGESQVEGDAETGQPGQCLWEADGSVDLAAPNETPFSVAVAAGDVAWYTNNQPLVEEDASFEQVTGIGDEAFAGDTRGGFQVGGAGITVELGISADPASHDTVVDVLERVEANYSPPD